MLERRLLVDHAIIEACGRWQGGRVAMTSIVLATDTAGATMEAAEVGVWHVQSAWVGKAEVLS